MIRFYILPMQHIIDERGDLRGPKYFKWRDDLTGLTVPRRGLDYGLIDAGLVVAQVSQAEHDWLIGHPDVVSPPLNIDQNISDAAIPKVVTVLEELRIPAGWVDNTYTYREILRMVGSLFKFSQHYHGTHREPLIDNVGQLDLEWNQIPQDRRQRILETADELGYDYSEIQNTWKVRKILKHLSDQWGDGPLSIGDIDL